MDRQFTRPPAITYNSRKDQIVFQTSLGTAIHYTLDGRDPRKPGGNPTAAAEAIQSGAAIALRGTNKVRARSLINGRGGTLASAEVTSSVPRTPAQ